MKSWHENHDYKNVCNISTFCYDNSSLHCINSVVVRYLNFDVNHNLNFDVNLLEHKSEDFEATCQKRSCAKLPLPLKI